MASRRSGLDLLIDALAALAAALLCALVVLILVDIGARYLRLFSLAWGLEASEYMLYAITFLGAPWVLREEGHIAVELVVERLAPGARRIARRIADLLGAVVCAVLLYYACRVAWRSYASGTMVHKSFIFPEWWVYAGMPLVFLILLAVYARWILRSAPR
ncbi:MAG TPA: TRAP transporter small permease [Burkholderiales bacterium]|nr:TRAP transporter small permease [Burkholderiales bacterium]